MSVSGEPPRGAPGDLVPCPACEGRWWGETCAVCGSWGVVHVAQAAELEELYPPQRGRGPEREG